MKKPKCDRPRDRFLRRIRDQRRQLSRDGKAASRFIRLREKPVYSGDTAV